MESQSLKLTRGEKDRRRRELLKSENPEEYRRRQDVANEKRKLRRQKLKDENPELHCEKREARNEKQNLQRQQLKDENPELHQQSLFERRQQHLDDKIAAWENLFDTYFEKNKVEMSQKKWRDLKNAEIEFFAEMFDNDISIPYLFEYRRSNLEFLKNNLDCCCAASVLFYLKTFVHYPHDKHKLTHCERRWVKNVVLDEYSPELDILRDRKIYRKEYYEDHRESEIQKKKLRKEEKSSDCKNDNLNRRFMNADPNKVLSISDICFTPAKFDFSFREEFKINLWKHLSEDEKEFFLEKWRLQREAYEKEVAELSIEYKTEFLNKYGGSNSCGNI